MSWPHQHWQGFFGVAYIWLLGNSVCAVLMCLQWTSQQVAGWLYNLSVLINLNPMDCHHWQFFTRSVNYHLSIATMKHWPLWFLQSLLVASSFPSNPFWSFLWWPRRSLHRCCPVFANAMTWFGKRHEFKQGKNFSDLRFNFDLSKKEFASWQFLPT